MKVGTKSLLFGVHQVFLHPLFVLWGWVKLYGFPDWKEFVCILIHDWGYWGCTDMDGSEGERHPEWAADWSFKKLDNSIAPQMYTQEGWQSMMAKYQELCIYHSRFYAKKYCEKPSKLCWADKLGSGLYPIWLWVFLGKLTGEIKEYISDPHYEIHGENDSYKFFKLYKNEVVPKLLKDNLQYSVIIGKYCGPCINCVRVLEQKHKLFCRWDGQDVTKRIHCCGSYLSESNVDKYSD